MAKKALSPLKQTTVRINGDNWKVKLFKPSDFNKMWPGDSAVCTYQHKKNFREIHFKNMNLSRDTVAHELQHAYFSYYDFSKLSYGRIEEKVCEITGKKYKVLHSLVNKIYRYLGKK